MGGGCNKMWDLTRKFPHNFWAAPDSFFTDGATVNRGADFAMMPSIFEPGGIVQHEFFVGETPVVAHRTGGLKDSVHEFDWNTQEGNGFVFEGICHNNFKEAIKRAVTVFHDKARYLRLRKNAFKSTMAGETVCKAWLGEFDRMIGKSILEQSRNKQASHAGSMLSVKNVSLTPQIMHKSPQKFPLATRFPDPLAKNLAQPFDITKVNDEILFGAEIEQKAPVGIKERIEPEVPPQFEGQFSAELEKAWANTITTNVMPMVDMMEDIGNYDDFYDLPAESV